MEATTNTNTERVTPEYLMEGDRIVGPFGTPTRVRNIDTDGETYVLTLDGEPFPYTIDRADIVTIVEAV